jgi:CRISPR-associated protein (TIGR02710 family)
MPPPDPYIVFGDIEAAEATRLFAAHDYPSAQRIFATLAQRLHAALAVASPGDTDLIAEAAPRAARYSASASLATAYAHWDAFNLDAARTSLGEHLALSNPTGRRAELLAAQQQDLVRLVETAGRAAGKGRDALTTLADPDAVLPLLGSLRSNARRREAQGRFDTAALLCYRCLELCSQHRLATWGLLTERPDMRELLRRRPRLDAEYRTVEERVGFEPRGLPRPGRNGKLAPIALFGGYMLLAALGDPLVEGFTIDLIRDRATLRNSSILAHGYRLILQAEYTAFAGLVDDLLDRLFIVLNRDRAAWEARSTFLPLE